MRADRETVQLFNCFSLCLFIVVVVLFRLLFIINCSTLVAALGKICGNFLATNFSNCLNISREKYIKYIYKYILRVGKAFDSN